MKSFPTFLSSLLGLGLGMGGLTETDAQGLTAVQFAAILQKTPRWGVVGSANFPAFSSVFKVPLEVENFDTLVRNPEVDTSPLPADLAAKGNQYIASIESWEVNMKPPLKNHWDTPYFVYQPNGKEQRWYWTNHLIVMPGLTYNEPAFTPFDAPTHFSQQKGMTWIYEWRSGQPTNLDSTGISDSLWLTLKSYTEIQERFESTWWVGLNRTYSGFNNENGEPVLSKTSRVIVDSNVTVKGRMDSGFFWSDFVPAEYKLKDPFPPLFIPQSKLPAIFSGQRLLKGLTWAKANLKPPFYVHWQWRSALYNAATYKDSVGLVSIASATQTDGAPSAGLDLVYFGNNPPQKPVAMRTDPRSGRNRLSRTATLAPYPKSAHGATQIRYAKPRAFNRARIDGLGRE